MADKDKLRFLTGQEANLKDKTLVRGQVYFAISSDTDSGKIYFDAPIDNNTTKRILMSSDHAKTADKATSADRATADSNGRKFTETYVSEIKLDNAGTTILYKYPDITTWKELKPKFLPLTGGTITGELYADSITAGDLLVNGSARFVNTILGNIETANQWKTARGFQIADSDAAHTSVSVNVNGSGNVVLKLPSTIKAALQGNADTATKATNDSNNKKITDEYLHRVSNTSSTLNQFSGAPKYLLGIESFTDGGEVKWQSVDSVKVGSASGADKWNTARNFQVSDSDAAHTGTAVSVNGSKAIVLPLPATIKATLEGNASSANKVNHKYTLTLGKTKQTAFDGSADVSITITPESIGALSKDEASAGAAKWSTARTFYVADADASNTGTGVSVDGTKDITLKLPSTIKASITGHASEDLPLAGGTMTGNISYKGSKATNSMIRFLNNTTDTSGNGISIGGGGVTVIGAGESSQNLTPAANEEALYLTSDGSIKFYTYCDTIGNKRGVILDTSRNFYPDVNNSGSMGTSSNKWNSMYATTFYGALSGTASNATSDIRGNAIINTYLTNVYAKSDDSSYLYKQVGPSSERSAELIGRYTPLDSDGLINMKYIPAAALERVVVVANQTAQYALTTANVQLGDVVKRNDTGQLYFVVDTNNLGNAGGYLQFTAGTAANVNWSGILNRPNIVGSASTKNIITLNDAKTVFTINRVNGDGTSDSYTLSPSFLPLAGGTMTGNIVFADSAFSANPTDTPGISWSGGTDSAKIFYRQTANNAGSLVLQVSDDGEEYIQFRHTQGGVVYLKPNTRELYPSANNTGSIGTTSYKWANMYATTFHGSLDGTANRATNDTNGKKITETYISEIKLDAAGTTIQFKAPDQTTYKEIKPKFLPLTGGTITGELYVDGGTTLASLLVNGDARFVNIIQGSISGNAGSATKWATAKAFYIADAEAKHTSSPQVNIDGSQSSYTLKLPSTIKATLEGNADTATKLTNLTEADKASSTNTWRRVWFAYDDNVNGRPAYSDTFAYQSSTGTVKATKFQGVLVGNATSADKWKTARNFITNLGSESPASIDGSTGPYNLGVTGTLPVSHGGTGVTTIAEIKAGKDADGNTISTTYQKLNPATLGYCNDYERCVIALCETSPANTGKNSHSVGKIHRKRDNGLTPVEIADVAFESQYGGDYATTYSMISNFENFSTVVNSGEGYRACTFIYNGIHYAGLEFSQTQAASFFWHGIGNFTPFLVKFYNNSTGTVLNNEINSSISFSNCTRINYIFIGSLKGNADSASRLNISSTDNAIARFDGTNGAIQNSTATLSDEGHLSVSGKINSKGDITIGSMNGDTVVGAGNFKIGVKNDSYGVMPYANNWNSIGSSNLYWYRAYVTNYYGTTSHITNYDSNGNIGAANTSSAAATLGYINFYNNAAAGATQTKTKLTANSGATTNLTITLPKTDGMLLNEGNYNDFAVKKASSSTDNAIVRWDGNDGRRIQNSLLSISDEGLLTLQTGNHIGAKLGSAYITSADASSGEIVLQNGHLRFGADSWDYNVWAGLKYTSSSKTIYLGLADGTIFTANSAQSGGTLALPGIRYFSINGKIAIDANDGWLRINEGKAFATGVYFGSNVVRTDGQLQVGDSGNKFYANSSGNGYFSNTLGIGGTNTSYKLYVNGTSYINGNTTVNGWLKVQNTTDSKNSQDSNASLAIQGGVSVAKQLSAKTIRIDGSGSDTIGSTTQGCTVHFNKTNNCIEFVFD